jgi:uncharacterized protein YbbK (DUF523 family)
LYAAVANDVRQLLRTAIRAGAGHRAIIASMIKVLVSACLLGEKVRYNGASASTDSSILAQWLNEGRVVPFCPEVAGGLGVPRPAAEISGTGGAAVLDGQAAVITAKGTDVTESFLRGAQLALAAARSQNVRVAILKDGSPSCGSGSIYDGTFSGIQRPGHGVTTALLERHGIRVFSERDVDEAARYLRRIEETGRPIEGAPEGAA